MGFFKSVGRHFISRVVKDNRGFIGSILPALGSLASSGIGKSVIGMGVTSGLSSLFGGNKQGDPISLQDLRTPEQIQATQLLSQLGSTGSAAGINLGEAYTGSLGSFDPTQLEQMGLSQLFSQSPTNTALSGAQDVFTKLSGAAFDPSVLDPFVKAAKRQGAEANDVLNRESAITGNRFGTQILGEKAKLSENVQNSIQQKLAELFLNQQNVSMQGAQGLANVGQLQQQNQQTNLQNLFQLGSLQRELANQEAQAKFNEFNRQRGETLGRVDLLTQAAERNPYLGISSIPGSPSPFSSLINSVLGSAGQTIGAGLPGAISSGLGSLGSGISNLFGRITQGPLQGPRQRSGAF